MASPHRTPKRPAQLNHVGDRVQLGRGLAWFLLLTLASTVLALFATTLERPELSGGVLSGVERWIEAVGPATAAITLVWVGLVLALVYLWVVSVAVVIARRRGVSNTLLEAVTPTLVKTVLTGTATMGLVSAVPAAAIAPHLGGPDLTRTATSSEVQNELVMPRNSGPVIHRAPDLEQGDGPVMRRVPDLERHDNDPVMRREPASEHDDSPVLRHDPAIEQNDGPIMRRTPVVGRGDAGPVVGPVPDRAPTVGDDPPIMRRSDPHQPDAEPAVGADDPTPSRPGLVPQPSSNGSPTQDRAPGPSADRQLEQWEVAPGDHLWSIAERVIRTTQPNADDQAITIYWQQLIEQNRDNLIDPANPDLIQPGQQLELPPLKQLPKTG